MLVTWIDLIVPASHFLLSKRDVHIFPIHIIDDGTSDPADSAPGVQSLRLNGGSFFQRIGLLTSQIQSLSMKKSITTN